MLAFYCEMGLLESAVALRFPYLVSKEHFKKWSLRYGNKPKSGTSKKPKCVSSRLHLSVQDAARLYLACAKAELPGFRVYFPASPHLLSGKSAREVVQESWPEVPLRCALEDLTAMVDISRITHETGWIPQTELHDLGITFD